MIGDLMGTWPKAPGGNQLVDAEIMYLQVDAGVLPMSLCVSIKN